MASSGYDDLKMVKLLLDMNEKLRSDRPDRTQELILFGASLEALRDVKEKVDRINERLHYMEAKPEKETRQEKSLIDQIKELKPKERDMLLQFLSPKEPVQEDMSDSISQDIELPASMGPIESVSSRKKTLVKEAVGKYGKLTSVQLARLIGLSRTRCNEYLKELELSGELTAFTEDKKRYYHLKN